MSGPVIALVDGEHHPAAVREALDRIDSERGVAGVVFCGGAEKLREPPSAEQYGHEVRAGDPHAALRGLAEDTGAPTVLDLADEPVLDPPARASLASSALHLGLRYEAPGMILDPPPEAEVEFDGPIVAVIGTGKRTGKTAVAGHLARLLREAGRSPVIVAMGRGGPAEPVLAEPGTGLEELERIVVEGGHAASDYLEDAVLAGVPAVGARRVGGGPAGEPFLSNVVEATRLAASLSPAAIVLEGSGACLPPVRADRTVCVVGDRAGALDHLGPSRLLRSDLALVMGGDGALRDDVARACPGRVLLARMVPEPVEPVPEGARPALFTTGADRVVGIDPVVASTNLAHREALAADLDRASAQGCDTYLAELKAAAIDTVAARARVEGARMVFVRNRPVGIDEDLDAALLEVAAGG